MHKDHAHVETRMSRNDSTDASICYDTDTDDEVSSEEKYSIEVAIDWEHKLVSKFFSHTADSLMHIYESEDVVNEILKYQAEVAEDLDVRRVVSEINDAINDAIVTDDELGAEVLQVVKTHYKGFIPYVDNYHEYAKKVSYKH